MFKSNLLESLRAELRQREEAERLLQERLEFERLLLDLSAALVNLPAGEVDAAITAALERIRVFYRVDRCGLLRAAPAGETWSISHAAFGPGIPELPLNTDFPAGLFPFAYRKLVQGEVFAFERLDDLPAEAAVDRQTALDWGIRSSLDIPIYVDCGITYVIVLNALGGERAWPADQHPRLRLIGEIFVGVLERKRTRLELEAQLAFKDLLSRVSAGLVDLPPDRADAEVHRLLGEVLSFYRLDRCAMVRSLPGKTSWEIVCVADVEGVPPVPMGAELPRSTNPWAYDRLTQAREVVSFTIPDELPPEAAVDRETWSGWGIRSNLNIPIILGDSTDWVFVANQVHGTRAWTEEVVKQLKLLGEIFAAAMERRNADLALRESEERLNLAAAAAGAGMWVLSAATGRFWITSHVRTLLEFPDEEELTLERFMTRVHPDDRGRVNAAVESSLANLDRFEEVEYRVLLPSGNTRWLVSRGRSCTDSNGTAGRIMGVTVDVTERRTMEETLRQKIEEIDALKLQLERENVYLREEIRLQHGHEEIVGRSEAMRKVLARVEQVAKTDATVLLQGETGTGKELLARTIHGLSGRRERPLVTINCAVLPPTLIESELFGRERGAYTGAMTRMAGRFELADRSTLFLDEIGELPLELQAKLLRVIEEGRFERLGSSRSLKVDVRVIAASNRDLAREVAAGRFRRDLFYRLNVFPIAVPPLRERPEDIPPLVWAFVKQYEKKLGNRIEHIPRRSMEDLQRYAWPGNARELRNIVEYAMITSDGGTLRLRSPEARPDELPADGSLKEIERRHILGVLARTGWRLTGEGGAAGMLGMKRTTLQSKMKKLGIRRPAGPTG